MTTAWQRGQFQAVWQRRVSHGHDEAQGAGPRENWFWFNALPVLAALRLGKKGHPLVSVLFVLARQSADPSLPNEAAALEEMDRGVLA
jgi:hypothetical protein